jgi:radical SAM protein with 4Fe4S-binding SPASM domain
MFVMHALTDSGMKGRIDMDKKLSKACTTCYIKDICKSDCGWRKSK